jgi:hypothetical protein
MHVHHREYHRGLKPWEYPSGLLQTLCAGCHAREHGILVQHSRLIPPPFGWDFVDMRDEEELCEQCEYCEEPIRYVFTIYHAEFGFLDVGTDCCDRMTGTEMASELQQLKSRRERFLGSPRWKRKRRALTIKQLGLRAFVFPWGHGFRVSMINSDGQSLFGNRLYRSEIQGKEAVFDSIETGAAAKAFERRRGTQ